MIKIDIPFPIPSKKNSYVIHLSSRMRKLMVQLGDMAGKNPYWIAPSKAVKDAQNALAYLFRSKINEKIDGDVELRVQTGNRRQDLDNLCGVIMDALQLSGRIQNDSQVSRLVVERSSTLKGIEVTINKWGGVSQ